MRRHLLCQSKRTAYQPIAPQRRMRLVAIIEFGKDFYTVQVPRRLFFMRRLGVIFDKNPQASNLDFIFERLGCQTTQIYREYDTLIENIPLSNNSQDCCGNSGLYVHIRANICVKRYRRRQNWFENRCEVRLVDIPLIIRCGKNCRPPSSGIPMGPSEQCPRCS